MTLRRALGLRLRRVGWGLVEQGQRLERLGHRMVSVGHEWTPTSRPAVVFFEGFTPDLYPLAVGTETFPVTWIPSGLEDAGAWSFSGSARLEPGVGLVWDERPEQDPPLEVEFPGLWGPLEGRDEE